MVPDKQARVSVLNSKPGPEGPVLSLDGQTCYILFSDPVAILS